MVPYTTDRQFPLKVMPLPFSSRLCSGRNVIKLLSPLALILFYAIHPVPLQNSVATNLAPKQARTATGSLAASGPIKISSTGSSTDVAQARNSSDLQTDENRNSQNNQLLRVSLKKVPNKERIEFLHIPKTGGSAVEYAGARKNITWGTCHFWNMSLNPTIFPGCRVDFANLINGCIGDNGFNHRGFNSCWHLPPGILKTMIRKTPYDGSSLFAVVRNPYRRLISEFYCRWSGYRGKDFTPKSLNAFAQERMNLHKMGKGRDHDIPQSHFIFRNISSVKTDGLPEQVVDHVLFLEDFAKQFQSLMREYNLTVELQSSKVNPGRYNSSSDMGLDGLSPQTIALVNELYKDDFSYLGYIMVNHTDLKEGWADAYNDRSIFMVT